MYCKTQVPCYLQVNIPRETTNKCFLLTRRNCKQLVITLTSGDGLKGIKIIVTNNLK